MADAPAAEPSAGAAEAPDTAAAVESAALASVRIARRCALVRVWRCCAVNMHGANSLPHTDTARSRGAALQRPPSAQNMTVVALRRELETALMVRSAGRQRTSL
jgi:hypothetical protein